MSILFASKTRGNTTTRRSYVMTVTFSDGEQSTTCLGASDDVHAKQQARDWHTRNAGYLSPIVSIDVRECSLATLDEQEAGQESMSSYVIQVFPDSDAIDAIFPEPDHESDAVTNLIETVRSVASRLDRDADGGLTPESEALWAALTEIDHAGKVVA